jgi:hypothetical protein
MNFVCQIEIYPTPLQAILLCFGQRKYLKMTAVKITETFQSKLFQNFLESLKCKD